MNLFGRKEKVRLPKMDNFKVKKKKVCQKLIKSRILEWKMLAGTVHRYLPA